jgi:hypothetical protein
MRGNKKQLIPLQSRLRLESNDKPRRPKRLIAIVISVTLCLVIALVSASSAWAQASNAALNGSVKDQAGSVIAGATVSATNIQSGTQTTNTTDGGGRYTLTNLVPGLYNIEAAQKGFATVVRHNQELLVGTTITIDFSLTISAVDQTVEVQADETTVQTTQNTVQNILETAQVDNLPLITRSFSDLASLTPGVLVGVGTASSANISINNAPVGQTGYLLDGHSNENDFFGGQFVNVAQDWIQEFSVLTNQFPVEYGNAAAGFVSAVTRSGTNNIHGRV